MGEPCIRRHFYSGAVLIKAGHRPMLRQIVCHNGGRRCRMMTRIWVIMIGPVQLTCFESVGEVVFKPMSSCIKRNAVAVWHSHFPVQPRASSLCCRRRVARQERKVLQPILEYVKRYVCKRRLLAMRSKSRQIAMLMLEVGPC